ncbi:hypothetical protein ACFX13_024872 [Malus domestica]
MGTKIISLREYGVIYSHLPESYVRPEFDRPRLSKDSECKNIPVVELASPNRAQTVQQIGDACKNKGFFLRLLTMGCQRKECKKNDRGGQ